MDVYKENIQSDGSLDTLSLGILVNGDLQNRGLIGDTWSPKASIRTLKQFLVDAVKNKSRVHQLNFIGDFLQTKVTNRLFVKLGNIYAHYFTEYSSYFRRVLRLVKCMYGITNHRKLFF